MSYDIKDMHTLSKLDVLSEEHKFEYRVVPISNFGFVEGTGSQSLGLEINQKLVYGTELTTGIRGDRVQPNSGYVIENENISRAYLKVSQGIFRNWGKKNNLASLNISKLRLKEREVVNERLRQDLILKTASLYYQVVEAKQIVAKSETALLRSRENLEVARSRQSAGMVSMVDVYRAELAVLDSENNVYSRELSLEKKKNAFEELLGMTGGQAVKVKSDVTWLQPVVPEDWREALLSNRLDWLSFIIKKEYSRIELDSAANMILPDVNLNFFVEQRGEGESFSDSMELDQTNWSVQLELRSSLDLFQERANLHKEKIKQRQLQREGVRLQSRIMREARESFDDLRTKERYYRINNKRLAQAAKALELTKVRYERGLSDNMDMLDAEAAYSAAQLDISSSIISYNIAGIELAHAMGILNLEWLENSLDNTDADIPEISMLNSNEPIESMVTGNE